MTQIETELRAALHERAERVHASPSLLGADYHPRTRRIRPRLAIAGGLAVAVVTAAAVLSFAGGTSNAFAGWTPKPTVASQAQMADAQDWCAANVPTPGLPLKLTDARGPFTFLVYSDASSNDFCILGPSFRNASGFISSPPVTVPAGSLHLWAEHTSMDSSQAYTTLIAQAADDVSAAVLTLEDGTTVTATVQGGWAVAWWPGADRAVSAELTTPSGTQTQTFSLSPCGLHNCNGGPHGGPDGGPGGG
jgi:hypothetical protein